MGRRLLQPIDGTKVDDDSQHHRDDIGIHGTNYDGPETLKAAHEIHEIPIISTTIRDIYRRLG